ncbi:MAG TPA: CBS domain-containing protein [Alphaproteobacteria bacterium]
MFVQSVLKGTGRKVAILRPEASVAEAAELLAPRDVQIVVVCDAQGKIVGVVTDSDIVRDLARCRGTERVCAPNIGALMSRNVVSCRPQDRVEQVLAVMKARGLRRIPVVDEAGGLAGLITMRDALHFLYEQAKLDEESLKEYFLGVGFH